MVFYTIGMVHIGIMLDMEQAGIGIVGPIIGGMDIDIPIFGTIINLYLFSSPNEFALSLSFY